MKERLKKYIRDVDENGFSLLELVVAVGILLALTVGGLLAYNGIMKSARVAAVQEAASEVLTAAVAYDLDNKADTVPTDAETEWNETSKKDDAGKAQIVVDVDDSVEKCLRVTATHSKGEEAIRQTGSGCVGDDDGDGGNGGSTNPGGEDDGGSTGPGDSDDNGSTGPGDTPSGKSRTALIIGSYSFPHDSYYDASFTDSSGASAWAARIGDTEEFDFEYAGDSWTTVDGEDMPDLRWSAKGYGYEVKDQEALMSCFVDSETDSSIYYICLWDGQHRDGSESTDPGGNGNNPGDDGGSENINHGVKGVQFELSWTARVPATVKASEMAMTSYDASGNIVERFAPSTFHDSDNDGFSIQAEYSQAAQANSSTVSRVCLSYEPEDGGSYVLKCRAPIHDTSGGRNQHVFQVGVTRTGQDDDITNAAWNQFWVSQGFAAPCGSALACSQ